MTSTQMSTGAEGNNTNISSTATTAQTSNETTSNSSDGEFYTNSDTLV
ncbi:hypothetical protein EG68_11563 [Paragonimus skrjabini miyazakii]|uniref:Uncharacterized protein n=1 Tax=Paragonimus skrjabini miyazakii TaxID=59628 RepID=A0A8S9YFA6_9TREM|nr:hypothetical protein EG68_11563 [Paragonimus skrjabini miyazakii]